MRDRQSADGEASDMAAAAGTVEEARVAAADQRPGRGWRIAPRLHHVQVSMPVDGDDEARRFWRDTIGLTEVPKPEPMAARGGCWFRAHDDAGEVVVEIHMSRQEPFVPASKAHPALVLDAIAELETLAAAVVDGGYEVVWDDRLTFPGYERFHCFDGFGNRVEVLAPA